MEIKVENHRFLGWHIDRAIDAAIADAKKAGCLLRFDFNCITVTVAGDSNATLIRRDWSRAMDGKTDGDVGPHPQHVLTADQIARDEQIDAENEARRAVNEAQYRLRAEEDRKEHAAALAAAPVMEREETKWTQGIEAQNGSAYGLATFQFAEDWARLMQARITAGENLSDIADECCTVADKAHGITGFMYGCAVSILAETWIYGDTLRRWHNTKYGRGDAKGTINPAVLTIAPSAPSTHEA